MKSFFILISESLVASHSNHELNQKVVIFDMKIPLNVKQTEEPGIYQNNTKLSDNEVFKEILKTRDEALVNGYEKVYFLVGFDVDLQGEYMASVLREELLSAGIDDDAIFRMPFVEDEYIMLQEFRPVEDFINYKGLEADFSAAIKRHNKSNNDNLPFMSFRKLMSLKILSEKKDSTFQIINNEGNSTFTYIINRMNNNKTSAGTKHKWVTIVE